MHQKNEAHGGTAHPSPSSFLTSEEQQPSVAQLRMPHAEEQRTGEGCRAGTLHPLCPRSWHVCQGALIFLSPCKWRHRTPKLRGSWCVARAGVPRLSKGIFKLSAPLNLTWHSALVAQATHLCWPGQHCPHLGHHRDRVCGLRISLPSTAAAHEATKCPGSSHTYRLRRNCQSWPSRPARVANPQLTGQALSRWDSIPRRQAEPLAAFVSCSQRDYACK